MDAETVKLIRALAMLAVELGKTIPEIVALFRASGVSEEAIRAADLENERDIYDRIEELRKGRVKQ